MEAPGIEPAFPGRATSALNRGPNSLAFACILRTIFNTLTWVIKNLWIDEEISLEAHVNPYTVIKI